MPRPCQHVGSKGPCRGNAITNDDYCFAHSPQLADERAAARRRGGLNGGKRSNLCVAIEGVEAPPESAAEAKTILSRVIFVLAQGKVDPNRAKVIVAACHEFLNAVKVSEMEETIKRLEQNQ